MTVCVALKASIDNHIRKTQATFTQHIKVRKRDINKGIKSDKAKLQDYDKDTDLEEADHVKAAVANDLESDKNGIKNYVKSAMAKVTAAKDAAEKDLKQGFHVAKKIKFGPTSITNNITLFQQTVNCPPLFPGVNVVLNPDIHVEGEIGIVVIGTIVPPRIANFSSITSRWLRVSIPLVVIEMLSDFSADVNAIFGINADVAAVFDSGRILMFEVGLPGMDIPGYA